MKTFITGGLGLIGSNIARILTSEYKADVVCLDNFDCYVDPLRADFADYRKYRLKGVRGVTVERGDVSNPMLISRLIKKHQPDIVYHLAAMPVVRPKNLCAEEAIKGSVVATTNIIEACAETNARFVYASSSMVYGDFVNEIQAESAPTNPREIYGTVKLAGEIITRGLCHFYNMPYVIVRPSAVYGPTDMNRRVTQIFLEKAIGGEMISIDGQDTRLDFTYVSDAARGFVLAGVMPFAINNTFNITYGQSRTLLEFVLCLKKYFPDLKYKIKKADDFHPKRGTLDISKAQKLIGYKPEYPIERGMPLMVEFAKSNYRPPK